MRAEDAPSTRPATSTTLASSLAGSSVVPESSDARAPPRGAGSPASVALPAGVAINPHPRVPRPSEQRPSSCGVTSAPPPDGLVSPGGPAASAGPRCNDSDDVGG